MSTKGETGHAGNSFAERFVTNWRQIVYTSIIVIVAAELIRTAFQGTLDLVLPDNPVLRVVFQWVAGIGLIFVIVLVSSCCHDQDRLLHAVRYLQTDPASEHHEKKPRGKHRLASVSVVRR